VPPKNAGQLTLPAFFNFPAVNPEITPKISI